MSHTHSRLLILAVAAWFAIILSSTPVNSRQPVKDDLPRSPSTSEMTSFRSPSGIPKDELKKAKELFATLAKYYADYVSNQRVYTTPQEFAPNTKGEPVKTVDQLIADLNRHLLIPGPGNRVGPDQADYIREFGAALDDALEKVINSPSERVVRVNATRILAAACRSGANPHYPTVTKLITAADTPPEVKYYAYQAAGNLLAAYDINNLETRSHSAPPKLVADLLTALRDAVEMPYSILPPPLGVDGKPTSFPPDQLQVIAFIRRQAIKALGTARFAEFPVPKAPTVYPAFTLARVAVEDPSITPPPTPSEAAEAVIGICNLSPPKGAANAEPYAFAMSDAVATGLLTFATPRAANPADKNLPWKGYSARLNDSLKGWGAVFDPNFNPNKPSASAPELIPTPITELVAEAERRILLPMEGTATKIETDQFREFRDRKLRVDKKWTLNPYRDNPKLTLPLKK
jgi:hypothetical protein